MRHKCLQLLLIAAASRAARPANKLSTSVRTLPNRNSSARCAGVRSGNPSTDTQLAPTGGTSLPNDAKRRASAKLASASRATVDWTTLGPFAQQFQQSGFTEPAGGLEPSRGHVAWLVREIRGLLLLFLV